MSTGPHVRAQPKRDRYSAVRFAVEVAAFCAGACLIVCAVGANQRWLDRHFLPSFFLPRQWYVTAEACVRLVLAVMGAAVAFPLRARLGRTLAASPAASASIALAAVLALGAGEWVLRHVHLQPAAWLFPEEEPRRRADAVLGWTLIPGRSARAKVGGRVIEYAVDSAGHRVERVDRPVDWDRPAIVFTGESVMFGEGLRWEETIPAQVAAMTGIQSANMAVHGYGSDQQFLRLEAELPRFRQPLAVVSLFMTALFSRNLEDDRPHLGPGRMWLPPHRRGRLMALAMTFAPYRTDGDVERGVALTRDVLQRTAALVQARGATPIVLVPQLGRESVVEYQLRRRILDDAAIPYLWIECADDWRLPWDRHPNARSARAMAEAIVGRLREAGVARGCCG